MLATNGPTNCPGQAMEGWVSIKLVVMALLTVTRSTVTVFPVQPLATGFTVIMAINCPLELFTDLKAGIVAPVPEAARPIEGSVLNQLNVVPAILLVKVTGFV